MTGGERVFSGRRGCRSGIEGGVISGLFQKANRRWRAGGLGAKLSRNPGRDNIDMTGRLRRNPQIPAKFQFRCTVDRAEFGHGPFGSGIGKSIGEDHMTLLKRRRKTLGHTAVLLLVLIASPTIAKDFGILTRMLYAAFLAEQGAAICAAADSAFANEIRGPMGILMCSTSKRKSRLALTQLKRFLC
jgi:hypothetical protein